MVTLKRIPMPGATVLELAGSLTLGNSCQELEWEVDQLLKEGAKMLVFDLSRLTHIDSAGIGIVVRTAAKLREHGGEFRPAGAHGQVQDIITMTRIDTLVPFYTDVQAALAPAAGASA